MTIPGFNGPCTREQPCRKNLDPSGISWMQGCWAYRNMTRCDWSDAVKVWVVVSDCGLNGPWVHGVYSKEPERSVVDEYVNRQRTFEMEDGRTGHSRVSGTTGYQNTEILEMELDGELQ